MIMGIINKILRIPCGIDTYFSKMEIKMDSLLDKCVSIEDKLNQDIKLLTEELNLYKSMLFTISNTIPDMMWAKDLDGKYIYANSAVIDGLLFDRSPIGKTDLEMASNAKEFFGLENHTFGERCANSDKVVIDKAINGVFEPDDGRFLESGKIKGAMVYLEVFKAPMFIKGQLVGVVGTGRVMTGYVEAYRDHNCKGCGQMYDIFKKYEFEED